MQYSIEVQWDPNSKEFQTTMESFRDVINSNADEEDVIIHATEQAFKYGADRMIEGIGFVKCLGRVEDENLYSGIDIDDDDPLSSVDVEYQ
ncbi:hypothetical protein EKK58_12565 [Candidatus Dependentiae bacterium]|nr:MAG: hypothetical protein EKK58_12565 [Candidatus Dependentiae bacterium]